MGCSLGWRAPFWGLGWHGEWLGFGWKVSLNGYVKSLEAGWFCVPLFVGARGYLGVLAFGLVRIIGCGAGGRTFEAA